MSTISQPQQTPIYASPVFWGLCLIILGTIVGSTLMVLSAGLTHAINVGLVMIGSLMIAVASSGARQAID